MAFSSSVDGHSGKHSFLFFSAGIFINVTLFFPHNFEHKDISFCCCFNKYGNSFVYGALYLLKLFLC